MVIGAIALIYLVMQLFLLGVAVYVLIGWGGTIWPLWLLIANLALGVAILARIALWRRT